MALLERHLYVKRSLLPGAGRGLFTKIPIKKGTRIVEYKGEIMTWKEVEKMPDYRNGYVFYFNLKYVIDAWRTKKSVAHFANDAQGIVRVKGLKNNAEYTTEGKRCFITATKDIPPRAEILVDYGREYWQAIRYNIRDEMKNRKQAGKKSKPGSLPHQAASRTPKRTNHHRSV